MPLTEELAKEIIQKSVRCTQATLRAFGIEGIPKTGSGCLEYLTNAGYKCTSEPHLRAMMMASWSRTADRSKDYLITTYGHAMAFVDGQLVDTEHKGFDKKRFVTFCWSVTRL